MNKTVTLIEDYDLSGGDAFTTGIPSKEFVNKVFSIAQDSVTGTNLTVQIKLQASVDGSAGWFDTDATNDTVTTADVTTTSAGFAALGTQYPFMRIAIVPNAGVTGGTCTVKLWGSDGK
jgi:hypothetical protein